MSDVSETMVKAAGDVLMQHGVNAPEQVIYQATRAALTVALATANARVKKAERLAATAENFARRFSMNDLAEDDDRQRQAVIDQVELFRAAST